MKIDKLVSKEFGLAVGAVFTVLCDRARKAGLLKNGKRYFFCPVQRQEQISGDNYRPLEDQLPWLAVQTIRDSINTLESSNLVEVWRKGDRLAFVRDEKGRRTQTRAHSYHIPDDILNTLSERKRSDTIVFKDGEAKRYGINEAIVLYELRYMLAKRRAKDKDNQIKSVEVSPHAMSQRLPLSPSTIRRARKKLVEHGELIKTQDTGYTLTNGTPLRFDGGKHIRRTELFPTVQQPVQESVVEPPAIALPRITSSFVPTGLTTLDNKIRGFDKGQLGFLFGHTGHGKTALMMQMALGAVRSGKKALVISLEEAKEHLAARLYANTFNLEYSKLYQCDEAESKQAQQAIASLSDPERRELINLKIKERRGCSTTVADLVQVISEYANEGFHPDVVFVDQFSFVKPSNEATTSWENEKRLAGELNAWASSSLQGEYPFALWVLAQAKGEPSKVFTRDSICGHKEIIQPASLAIGIGHTDDEPRKLTLFSLKVRHNASFGLTLKCDLSRMQIGLLGGGTENGAENELALPS